jgi:hypothetical protein
MRFCYLLPPFERSSPRCTFSRRQGILVIAPNRPGVNRQLRRTRCSRRVRRPQSASLRNRRLLPLAVALREGPLTEPTAGAQPCRGNASSGLIWGPRSPDYTLSGRGGFSRSLRLSVDQHAATICSRRFVARPPPLSEEECRTSAELLLPPVKVRIPPAQPITTDLAGLGPQRTAVGSPAGCHSRRCRGRSGRGWSGRRNCRIAYPEHDANFYAEGVRRGGTLRGGGTFSGRGRSS